ncbi:MAG TPA: HAMP domain-containing sensor histidine kinase [Solirubrobacterales bacterium]|nr:HAMP domain-containing sensor histidine kinase [Solirubrobacterales bacterium]
MVGDRTTGGQRLFRPGSWPVRWRLAAVSAGLTLAILLVFGITIGQVATQRIRSDFDGEVRNAAQTLATEFRIVYTPFGSYAEEGPRLPDFVHADDARARVLDVDGNVKRHTTAAADLGDLSSGMSEHNGMRVATAEIVSETGEVTGYVQYGRDLSHVDATVGRLWLFVFAGVFGGTLLATLAGMTIASRAMRPISSLTATARKIATTRDPSLQMPEPAVDDEVGELARTLEEMLRSLDAARAEREGAMQKQREFVADASHELRTPLTSVLANLELLQTSLRGAGEAEDREVVDSALRSSRRMSRLVADLLLLARADAGRHGERRRCDLALVAGDAAAEVAPMLGDHDLAIEMPRPTFVLGNPDELHRLALNLLDNAVNHTPAGCRIELSLHERDGEAVLEVGDEGPGIPSELRAQVFDRFVRGEGRADVAAVPGTGLGLAIVRSVAESHGGKAEIADSPSGGALFRIRLPLAKSEKVVTDPLKTL